jgi:hypothetical protein
MSVKINILKYDSPKAAIKSIQRLEASRKIKDEQKLINAKIVRHVASTKAKRSATLSERANYKKVTSVYSVYILKVERRMKKATST